MIRVATIGTPVGHNTQIIDDKLIVIVPLLEFGTTGGDTNYTDSVSDHHKT